MDASIEDLRRSQRAMIVVRWVGAVFAAAQVLVYETGGVEYPDPSYRAVGLVLAGLLAAGNLGILAANRRAATAAGARRVALAGIGLDLLVVEGFVFLFTFDALSALWAVLFILPLEGAILLQLRGAIGTWLVATTAYVAREVWGAGRFPDAYPTGVLWNSVSFRLGLVLLVAMVAGLMARDLTRQRSQLREALSHVQRVDRLRASLVSTLAHDVRNPLTAIRGAVKMLLSHGEQMGGATAKELLGAADRQAERLERLAVDLLDLARLERGRLELRLERVDLRDLVIEALSFADQEDRYEVDIAAGILVRGDRGRLEQIVVNIAANALIYGEPPFMAEARTLDGSVELTLRDHGPGVSSAESPLLFEPFRGEDSTASVGLGLAIVQGLAEAHGGDVTYRQNEPRGACFVVTLPLEGPER